MGAASIAKIIAKWVDKGYPEEVAGRIASGDLPMDEASRLARAQEQGYGPVLYHGSTNPDMTEIAPMEVGKRNATGGNGLFLTDNPRVASTYAYDARVNGGKGPEGATIYPLRVRDTGRDDWVTVKDRGHRGEEYSTWWDEIPAENIRGMDTDMYEAGQYLETDQINRTANRQGKKLVEYTNLYDSSEDVYSVGGTEVPSNVTAVLDNTLVRSPNAAFDPQYTGSNIMGSLLAGGVGLGALGQSDEADASVASLAARGLRLVEGKSPAATPSDNLFNIVDGQGGKIGGAEFYVTPDGDLSAYNMRLNPEHRGSGIMSEAYDAVEEITGRMIEPSDVLTDDGMKFWIRRDPSRMRELQQGGRFDHLEEDLFDSLFEEALRPKR